jgi:hypothetical protein
MSDDHSKVPDRLPDWLLERLALDELSEDKKRDALQRLAQEPGGMARLEALKRSDAEILATYDPKVMVARIVDRSRRQAFRRERPKRWTVVAFGLAAATAAAMALLALPSARNVMLVPWESDTRVKGLEPTLLVFRRTPHGIEQLAEGSEARVGDQLQLAYVAAGRKYGAIFSIDGRGVVTMHYPEGHGHETADLRLPPKAKGASGPTALSQAYALDDAPDFERFFFVTSDASFDLERVLAAARALGADPQVARAGHLSLPRGVSQVTFTLNKAQP